MKKNSNVNPSVFVGSGNTIVSYGEGHYSLGTEVLFTFEHDDSEKQRYTGDNLIVTVGILNPVIGKAPNQRGYIVFFNPLHLEVRLYHGHPELDKKWIAQWTTEEIEPVVKEIFNEAIKEFSIEQVFHWITNQKHSAAEREVLKAKKQIHQALGLL